MNAIPAELAEYVSEFRFPSGATIRRMNSSLADRQGWVLALSSVTFVYSDGSIGSLPRHRAFSELGFPGGEDDLKTDQDWASYTARERELSELLLVDLDQAYKLAADCGAANRRARNGEQVVVLERPREPGPQQERYAVVINDGSDDSWSHGEYVRVRFEDDTEGTVKLSSLRLSD